MFHLGFTGTSQGMNKNQKETLEYLFEKVAKIDLVVLHHGDCIGADEEADYIAFYGYKFCTHIHPPLNPYKRAFCNKKHIGRMEPEKDYLERNRDIVDACEIIVATPKEDKEVLRSGTWATIRYAQKKKKPLLIICPDSKMLGWNNFYGIVDNPLYFSN